MADIPNEFEANALINKSVKQVTPIEKQFHDQLDQLEKSGAKVDEQLNKISDTLGKIVGESNYEDEANKLVKQMQMQDLQDKFNGKKTTQPISEEQNVINQVMDWVTLDSQAELDKIAIPTTPPSKKQSIDPSGYKNIRNSMDDLQDALTQQTKSDNESLNQTSNFNEPTTTQKETAKNIKPQNNVFENLQVKPEPIQNIYPEINTTSSHATETNSTFKNLFNTEVKKEQAHSDVESIYPTLTNAVPPQPQYTEDNAPSAPSYEAVFGNQESQINQNNSEKMEQQPRFTEDYTPQNKESSFFEKLGSTIIQLFNKSAELTNSMLYEVTQAIKGSKDLEQHEQLMNDVNEVTHKKAERTIIPTDINIEKENSADSTIKLKQQVSADKDALKETAKTHAKTDTVPKETSSLDSQQNKGMQKGINYNVNINKFNALKKKVTEITSEHNIHNNVENVQLTATTEVTNSNFAEPAAQATTINNGNQMQSGLDLKNLLANIKIEVNIEQDARNEAKAANAVPSDSPIMRLGP